MVCKIEDKHVAVDFGLGQPRVRAIPTVLPFFSIRRRSFSGHTEHGCNEVAGIGFVLGTMALFFLNGVDNLWFKVACCLFVKCSVLGQIAPEASSEEVGTEKGNQDSVLESKVEGLFVAQCIFTCLHIRIRRMGLQLLETSGREKREEEDP